jgi:hypothetical protein
MAQAVRPRPLTAEDWVRACVSPCVSFSGQSGIGKYFLRFLLYFTVSIIPTCLRTHMSVCLITLVYKIFFFSVTSTKVVELNSIFYAEFKFVLSFSLSRKVFK